VFSRFRRREPGSYFTRGSRLCMFLCVDHPRASPIINKNTIKIMCWAYKASNVWTRGSRLCMFLCVDHSRASPIINKRQLKTCFGPIKPLMCGPADLEVLFAFGSTRPRPPGPVSLSPSPGPCALRARPSHKKSQTMSKSNIRNAPDQNKTSPEPGPSQRSCFRTL